MSIINSDSVRMGASGATGYTIDQSIRFNDDDSAYLSRTPTSNPTGGDASGAKKFTVSCWLKRGKLSTAQSVIAANTSVSSVMALQLAASSGSTLADQIDFDQESGGSTRDRMIPAALYRDVSAWYHLCVMVDTTQAAAADRFKIAINGVLVSTWYTNDPPALDAYFEWNKNGVLQRIGSNSYSVSGLFDGYIAEFHNVDGVAAETDFGETNDDGVWVPKAYTGSYGTNGFYITGSDSSDLGADYSGNSNDLTSSGLTSADQMLDTPTDNFPTFSNTIRGLESYTASNLTWGNLVNISDGGLKMIGATAGANLAGATMAFPSSGKYYFEATFIGAATSYFGISPLYDESKIVWYRDNGWTMRNSSSWTTTGTNSYTDTDVLSVSVNMDDLEVKFYKNNALEVTISLTAGVEYIPTAFGGNNTLGYTFNFGASAFTYTPPTGFVALSTANLPAPALTDGSANFQTTLYTGNGSATARSFTGVGFQPDFLWKKIRSGADHHWLHDAVRGADKGLNSNRTDSEATSTRLTSFDSDGFTFTTSDPDTNGSSSTYVAWQWLAGNGTASNTDGSITSTVSANVDAGFSVISYTGNATGGATIGHGLSDAPSVVITKSRSSSSFHWYVYHPSNGATKYMRLNDTSAVFTDSAAWNNTAPTSSVITLGNSSATNNAGTMIAYAFAEVAGYSKFGSYTGNGSADGSVVNLGFAPAFVMVKRSDSTSGWNTFDIQREGYNVDNDQLVANTTAAETTTDYLDLLSGGFKLRSTSTEVNASGGTYVYLAFAERPFGGDGVAPATAR